MKTRVRTLSSLILLGLCLAPLSFGQPQEASSEEWKKSALKVFMDCGFCDIEYIKTEITFVNYVRDRKEAQVHVLISLQSTGSGGREYTLTFLGQHEYSGQEDVLKYYSHKTDTDESIRLGLVQTLKLGLMRYVAKTPISGRIHQLEGRGQAHVGDRPMEFLGLQLERWRLLQRAESRTYEPDDIGSLSANRVTPEMKLRMSAAAIHYGNKYDWTARND